MKSLRLLTLLVLLLPALPLHAANPSAIKTKPFAAFDHDYVLIALGDSLTQGAMDGIINFKTIPRVSAKSA
jgi:hypothetical protein